MKSKQHDLFMGFMEAANESADDFPDGAWWAYLEDSAEVCMKTNKITDIGDGNDAVHYYLEHHNEGIADTVTAKVGT